MKYDIIVIGAGSGGLNIAGFMNTAGFKVLLIDKSDRSIGGDCLNFGCVPSKALIHVSRLCYDAKEAMPFGLTTKGKVDIKRVMNYVSSKVNVIRKHENADHFRRKGMDVVLGLAKFAGKNKVSVNGRVYTGKKILLATGSRPRTLTTPGVEKVDYYTNETIFGMKKLPEHLVIVGGGPVGIELGQAFRRFGSKVSVINGGSIFLPKERPEIAHVLKEQLEKEGMKFYFNSRPKEFTSAKNIVIENKNGKKTTLHFDALLVSTGRQLNTEGLDLEKAGIQMDGHKLNVDNYLRTTNKRVLLCGDIVGSYQFTHAAELHAAVIINNFFSPFKKKVSYDHLSWVTYTSPEIATFGLNEGTLTKRKIAYEKLELDFTDDDRAIVDDFTKGRMVLFISKGKILGGSMVAMNAGELFQELILANTSKLDIKEIIHKIYPYPTAGRVNKTIIGHHFMKKLTPRSKKILKWLY